MSAAAIVLLPVLVWGCDEDPTCVDCCPDCWLPPYPPTSPENVLVNLAASYERREIDQYAVLLDPDFRFYFQPDDIPGGLERDYWNRDEDSTGTGALFGATTEVSAIYVDLGAFASEDAGRIDEPGAKRIRLTHVKIEVDQVNEAVLLVQGDIQDMYFRKGRAAAGTDSTKWYLFEWWDESGGERLKPAGGAPDTASGLAESNAHIQPTTWGSIKARF